MRKDSPPAASLLLIGLIVASAARADDAASRHVTLELDGEIVQGAYTMPIQVGTPPQTFDVVVDTGSSNLILLGDASLCDNCTQDVTQRAFDPNRSSTAKLDPTEFTIEYGSGSLRAKNVTDEISVGGLPTIDYEFGVMTHDVSIGNILGLAYRSVARPEDDPPVPFFDELVRQTGIADKFSILLCDPGKSTITLGDDGVAATQQVAITEEKWYVVPAKKLQIKGGRSLGKVSVPAVVDSGTTDLAVPTRMHAKIMKALEKVAAAHDVSLAGELLKIPDSLIPRFPTFQVVIENVRGQTIVLDIAPETYFLKVSTVGYLLRIDVRDDQLLLGQVFMKNYRVIFDRANKRIGLASNDACSGS